MVIVMYLTLITNKAESKYISMRLDGNLNKKDRSEKNCETSRFESFKQKEKNVWLCQLK